MQRVRPPSDREHEPGSQEESFPQTEGDDRSELRCPYCHGNLPQGNLASACSKCGTLHHVSCFGAHGSCSTHGCGGNHARTLRVGESDPNPHALSCALCRKPTPDGVLVVVCGCGRILDTSCYEAVGNCGAQLCHQPAELLTPEQAALARSVRPLVTAGVFIGSICTVLAVALGLVAAIEGNAPPPVWAFVVISGLGGVLGWIMTGVGLSKQNAVKTAREASPPRSAPDARSSSGSK